MDHFSWCQMRFHSARVLFEDLMESRAGDLGHPVTDDFFGFMKWINPIVFEWFEEDHEDCFRFMAMAFTKIRSNLLFSKNWGQAFTNRPDSPEFVDEFDEDANKWFIFPLSDNPSEEETSDEVKDVDG